MDIKKVLAISASILIPAAIAYALNPILVAAAVAPGLAYLIYVQRKEKIDREPLYALALAFFLGFTAVTIASIALEIVVQIGEVLDTVLVAPIVEETFKLVGVAIIAARISAFNETDDGIAYGAAVGLGFATFEAITYAYSSTDPILVGAARAISSTLLHAATAALTGYAVAIRKFRHNPNVVLPALTAAIILHAIHNFLALEVNIPTLIILDVTAFLGIIKQLK